MALDPLCEISDVRARMGDPGLATGTTDEDEQDEVIDRKILFATEQIENELLSRIQDALGANETNSYGQNAETILTKLHDQTILKSCAVVWTIYFMLEEGEQVQRFGHGAAGDSISKMMDRWRKDKYAEMSKAWPRLRFDFDGSGTISTIESSFNNTFSSVRITA